MEVILAVAFGRVVNVQRGEADKLTEAAQNIFAGIQEKSASRALIMIPVLGERILLWQQPTYSNQYRSLPIPVSSNSTFL